MGEFASKGVAGSGLGLGIAGTALGLLNANGNGGSLLGGLFGGGNCQNAQAGMALNALAEKDAKIAELTAMRYSDNQDAAVYKQTLADNKTLRDEMYAYITPIAQESAANRERVAVLEAQQKCEAEKAQLREQIITQKIDRVASDCACGLNNLATEVGCLKARVNAITKEVVPLGAICPQPITQKIDRVASDCACGLNNLATEVGCLKARVNAITKEVVPLGAICPQPMPRYNEWTSPEGATQVTVSNPARTTAQQ